jgi:hypothetical protein
VLKTVLDFTAHTRLDKNFGATSSTPPLPSNIIFLHFSLSFFAPIGRGDFNLKLDDHIILMKAEAWKIKWRRQKFRIILK